jgi:hypothetical protein
VVQGLFGLMDEHADNPLRRTTAPAGYAARPGTGPAGETCGSCAHRCKMKHSKAWSKCGLMRYTWTGGIKTDIAVRSPACKHWIERQPD